MFIHDDVALDPQSVEQMVRRMADDEYTAIVGPKLVAWDDPSRLEEVGMAIDRFGYPYKGLEEGEIDLGQHDTPNEVFYVTSSCMLVLHDVFKEIRGWDARMRAFSEDVDFCWRARLAGHVVRVEPSARGRHAIALAKGLRQSRFSPSRYYIRRNRFRTILKNASGLRLLALIPQFILLALGEMIGFLVLRQPGEILNLFRAFGWNTITLPQTIAERRRVQRTRTVTDRAMKRLIVRQTARVRFYIAHQTDRLEEAWGRRAEVFSIRGDRVQKMAGKLVGKWGAVALLLTIGLLLGFRHFLWGPSVSVGDLLPFPERPIAMWRAFGSPWQGAGLGQPGVSPPAFVGLGAFPIVSFGAEGAAQKLLVMTFGAIAGLGAYRLLTDVVDRQARIVAAFVYTLGTIGYAAIREGSLSALALGVAAPFVLHSMLRLTGWVRPAGFEGGRELARAALWSAFSAAFVPGSLILYVLVGLALAAARGLFAPRAIRSFFAAFIALVIGWLLLLPWSASWTGEGGPLGRLLSEETRSFYQASFEGHGMASVALGQTPDGPTLLGLALPLFGLVAVLGSEGQRRRVALLLWGIVAISGVIVAAIASGTIPPIVASPTEAGVLPALAFAGLAGLAFGAFKLDLPRRGVGVVHALSLGLLSVGAVLLVLSLGRAMWEGAWEPGRGVQSREHSETVEQIRSLLLADAEQVGPFRTLWVGSSWHKGATSAAIPPGDHLLSGSRGRILTELFQRDSGTGQPDFDRVIASIEEATTDRGGALLGAFNVRYVVLDPDHEALRSWLSQRDLAVSRQEESYLLLENDSMLARAAVYDRVPVYIQAIEESDPRLAAAEPESERATIDQVSSHEFSGERVTGPGVILVAETEDDGWAANIDGVELERLDGGWANAFEIPAGPSGNVTVGYGRSTGSLITLALLGLAWVMVIGAATSRGNKKGPP